MRLASIYLILSMLWMASVYGYPAEEPSAEIFDDDNLLIVDMRLNNYILAEDLFLYASPEFTLIPLQAFFDAIEFPILVNPLENTASGWYLKTDQKFEMDLNNNKLQLSDKNLPLGNDINIFNDSFDIYVDIQLLESWFPIELDLRYSQLRLVLEPTELLPVQKRIERENLRKRIVSTSKDSLPIIEDQYRRANWPMIDLNLDSSIQDREDDESRAADVGFFMQSSGDLLKMQSNFSLSRPSLSEGSNARFTLQRKQSHPDKHLYSSLNAVALGDVFSVSDSLLFTSGTGLGVDLQFGQARTLSDFGKNIIEGFSTPGWEVEVYRNNVLLDFQTVSEDGRYRFEDLPLEYGENIFDIRLFGPQGQEETRRETLNIGNNALPDGEFYTRLHYSNVNQSVFNTAPSFSGDENNPDSEQYGYFTHERGISNQLSLSVIAAEHSNPDDQQKSRNYFGGGFAYSFSSVALNGQRISQLGHGTAHSLGLQTRVGNTSISANHKQYHDFYSDRSDSGRIKKDSELRFNSYIGELFRAPITHQLIFNYEQAINSEHVLKVENRIGFNGLGGRINWDNVYTDGSSDSQNTGNLRYLRTAGVKLNVRAGLQYQTDNGFEISGGNTTWSWHPEPDWNLQVSTNMDFSGGGNNSLIISSARKFKQALVSFDAAIVEGGRGSIGLSAEFSLSRDDNSWQAQQRRQANFGRLRAQVFLDKNNNGHYDSNEETLENVHFEGINSWRDLATDENGVTYLSELRDSVPSRIKLDKGSLEDPFWISDFDEAQIISHAGGLINLKLPIQQTVEIEGSITLHHQDGTQQSVPGVPVVLYDREDNKVLETITEFDGYFVLNSVLPGAYKLSIHPDALSKLNLQQIKPINLQLSGDEGVVYLDAIKVRPVR